MNSPADWRSRDAQRGGEPGGQWSDRPSKGVWSPDASHNAAIGVLLVAVVGLLIYWIGWVIRLDRLPTPMLALVATRYDAPAPPNALAVEDLDWIRNRFANYKNVDLTVPQGDTQTTPGFLQRLSEFLSDPDNAPERDKPRTLIVYVSAIGLVDSQGEPCLLLPGHDPLDESDWLRWSTLHEKLREERPDRAAVAVLLDASHVQTEWSLGVIQNGFVPILDERLKREADDRLVVVSASSGLQGRLSDPARLATPFAYFAADGLRGGADVRGDNNGDVTVAELVAYLQDRVVRWSQDHAGWEQRPAVIGPEAADGESLLLAAVANYRDPIELSPEPVEDATPQASVDLWEAFGNLRDAARFDPVAYARFASELRRIDRCLLAGSGYSKEAPDLIKAAESHVATLRATRPYAEGVRPGSIPARRVLAVASTSRTELASAWDAWIEKPDENPPPADYADRVTIVWRRLLALGNPPSQDDLRLSVAFLGDRGTTIDFPEAVLIRLLHDHVDWAEGGATSDLRQMLRAFDEAWRLAIPPRPEVARWVAPHLNRVVERLRLAFDHLLVGDAASLRKADELIVASRQTLEDIAALSSAATAACAARDDALAFELLAGEWAQRMAFRDRQERHLLDTELASRSRRGRH